MFYKLLCIFMIFLNIVCFPTASYGILWNSNNGLRLCFLKRSSAVAVLTVLYKGPPLLERSGRVLCSHISVRMLRPQRGSCRSCLRETLGCAASVLKQQGSSICCIEHHPGALGGISKAGGGPSGE